MSMILIPSILSAVDFTAPRTDWTAALARYTRKRRTDLGLSLEHAAELAGLEFSQWCALESGWVPDSENLSVIRAIAATLEVAWVDYSFLALMAACQRPCPEKSTGEA